MRCRYDGSEKETVFNNLNWPHAITIDYKSKSLLENRTREFLNLQFFRRSTVRRRIDRRNDIRCGFVNFSEYLEHGNLQRVGLATVRCFDGIVQQRKHNRVRVRRDCTYSLTTLIAVQSLISVLSLVSVQSLISVQPESSERHRVRGRQQKQAVIQNQLHGRRGLVESVRARSVF